MAYGPVSATVTVTNVVSSAFSVSILPANQARHGVSIYNDSTQILYLLVGGVAPASTSNYTIQIAALGYWESPFNETVALTGIWASASGNALVTEYT